MERYWSTPEIWKGRTVYVLGGGDSLHDMDWSTLVNKRVIGCNDNYLLGPEVVDVAYFGDHGWFVKHRYEYSQFSGLKVSCTNKDLGVTWVLRLKRRPAGIRLEPDLIAWNHNTGASAINLAVKFGAKKIILLGFDMILSGRGRQNHYDKIKHPDPDESVFPKHIRWCEFVAVQMKVKCPDVEVINANMGSALECFPKVTRESVL